MRTIPRLAVAVASLAFVASPVRAQSISLGLRGTGTYPTGSFAAPQVSSSSAQVAGAKSGFGYGLNVGLDFGPIGLYGGFDHVTFGYQTAEFEGDGKYTLQGVTLGLKLSSMSSGVRPFVKGGVTFNNLEGSFGSSSTSSTPFTTNKTPGFELGAGVDIGLLGIVSLSPQVRYIGQNLKVKVPGVSAPTSSGQGVNYFTFDLGLSIHPPFGGIH
jgi:hypothetical protein